ncbi:penicillin-binding protein 2 [Galenea microaerophila]
MQRYSVPPDQNLEKSKQQFKLRLWIALAFVILSFLLLIGRMAYLQIVHYKHYHSMAEGNRISVEVIPPIRGKIYDRNHILLADNQPTYALRFSRERNMNIDALLNLLQTLLPELSPQQLAEFGQQMKQTRVFNHITSAFNLTEAQAARIAVNNYRLPGLSLTARLKRTYPFANIGVHAIGYVGRINAKDAQNLDPERYQGTDSIGKTGIEQYYESELHGKPGLQYVETNAKGRIIRKLKAIPPVKGQDIQLTLDIRLQRYAESLLKGHKGTIVAFKPATGEILAYVSQPDYDPNIFVDGISQKAYNALLYNPQQPLFNRVKNGQYPPGSTVKPFVALGAIERDIISPKETIFDPGYLDFGGQRYRDWKRYGHGTVDMDKAITQSCDTYFYHLGLKMGIDTLHDILYPFGFGHPTGIDLRNESSGILPSKAWKRAKRKEPWYRGETINVVIGQGYMLATPLQLAKAVSILANHGQIIRPHLNIQATSQPEPSEQTPDTASSEKPLSQIPIRDIRNWQKVITAMTHVMHAPNGTASKYTRGLPFKMAGKTGTAQVFSLNEAEYNAKEIKQSLHDHSLFIGFAPVKSPQIAVSVIVENGTAKAAPLGVKVAKYYLTQLSDMGRRKP